MRKPESQFFPCGNCFSGCFNSFLKEAFASWRSSLTFLSHIAGDQVCWFLDLFFYHRGQKCERDSRISRIHQQVASPASWDLSVLEKWRLLSGHFCNCKVSHKLPANSQGVPSPPLWSVFGFVFSYLLDSVLFIL